jgi:hypothetical protein
MRIPSRFSLIKNYAGRGIFMLPPARKDIAHPFREGNENHIKATPGKDKTAGEERRNAAHAA